MLIEDDLHGTITTKWTDAKRLSDPRLDEYRKLMTEAGIQELGGGWPRQEEIFWMDMQGSVIAGRDKAIVYSEKQLSPILPSLNTPCSEEVNCTAYRHINGPWWLMREDDF